MVRRGVRRLSHGTSRPMRVAHHRVGARSLGGDHHLPASPHTVLVRAEIGRTGLIVAAVLGLIAALLAPSLLAPSPALASGHVTCPAGAAVWTGTSTSGDTTWWNVAGNWDGDVPGVAGEVGAHACIPDGGCGRSAPTTPRRPCTYRAWQRAPLAPPAPPPSPHPSRRPADGVTLVP